MTPEKVKSVFKQYKALALGGWGESGAKKMPEEYYSRYFTTVPESLRVARRHLAWMCDEATKFVDEGRMEKAMRWLGFMQGVLWSCGVRTLDQLKDDSRPATGAESIREAEDERVVALIDEAAATLGVNYAELEARVLAGMLSADYSAALADMRRRGVKLDEDVVAQLRAELPPNLNMKGATTGRFRSDQPNVVHVGRMTGKTPQIQNLKDAIERIRELERENELLRIKPHKVPMLDHNPPSDPEALLRENHDLREHVQRLKVDRQRYKVAAFMAGCGAGAEKINEELRKQGLISEEPVEQGRWTGMDVEQLHEKLKEQGLLDGPVRPKTSDPDPFKELADMQDEVIKRTAIPAHLLTRKPNK